MVKITGGGAFSAKIGRFAGAEAKRRVGGALYEAGDLIAAEASVLITTGAISGKNHIASLPGQPPNNDSGTLKGHIETVQVQQLKVEVSSNATYAAALEFGTSKMAERPYMRPAVAKNRNEAAALVARAISSVGKG